VWIWCSQADKFWRELLPLKVPAGFCRSSERNSFPNPGNLNGEVYPPVGKRVGKERVTKGTFKEVFQGFFRVEEAAKIFIIAAERVSPKKPGGSLFVQQMGGGLNMGKNPPFWENLARGLLKDPLFLWGEKNSPPL